MTILADETRNEPDGKNGINNDSEDVHLFSSPPKVEHTEHEDDDDASDDRASAATFIVFIVMLVDAHIKQLVCPVYI